MNSDAKKYLKDCKRVFPFIRVKEKNFFNKFTNNINEHTDEKEDVTYQELVQRIGSPKDVMISYVQDCEDSYLIGKMNAKKLMNRIFVTISIILITGLSIVCYYEWRTVEEAKDQKIITTETTIEQNSERGEIK